MLASGTFTMAVSYLMLLCDNVIAGQVIGPDGVAAVNMTAPLIGLSGFLASCISEGTSILYSRLIGEMKRDKADRILGMGAVATVMLAVLIPTLFFLFREPYLLSIGASGDIFTYAEEYYLLLPLDAAVLILCSYAEQAVYSDGDTRLVNLSYVSQIGGNLVLSLFLARYMGMRGIMLGTVIGNGMALLILSMHLLKKENTLHFVFYLSWEDLVRCVKYSITDAVIHLLWSIMDYVLVLFITRNYGARYLPVMAIVFSLIEIALVFDGIGAAIQPLIGVYFGEHNHLMIRRLMRDALFTAVVEGTAATVLVFAFAPQFAGFFGIRDAMLLDESVTAIRIVSLTMAGASLFMLESSYYLYIDHIAFSAGMIVLKDGVFGILLPVLFSVPFGVSGLWIGVAAAPVAGLAASMAFLYLRVGRDLFPWLLDIRRTEIFVYDAELSPDASAAASARIHAQMKAHHYPEKTAQKAALFTEEISLTVIERNHGERVLIEYSLLFEEDYVRLVIRDSGVVFDVTDPDIRITGLSSFVISSLLRMKDEKAYITTTGYNRNLIRFDSAFSKQSGNTPAYLENNGRGSVT